MGDHVERDIEHVEGERLELLEGQKNGVCPDRVQPAVSVEVLWFGDFLPIDENRNNLCASGVKLVQALVKNAFIPAFRIFLESVSLVQNHPMS